MRELETALVAALALAGCGRAPRTAARVASTPHVLLADERTQALQVIGTLHRTVAGHATIPVVLELSCSDLSSFLVTRSLDADCAVSGDSGQTFHGRVSEIRRTHATAGPVPADHVYGLVTVDVDNPHATILPGRLVAASFPDRHGSPLILFGLARAPRDGDLALGQAR